MSKHGVIVIAFIFSSAIVSAMSPEDIIRRMEANEVHSSAVSEGAMTIVDRFGTKEITFVAWSAGEEDSLIEFTSPDEKGQKILRTADEIYLYYPDAEEIIRIQGAALRESVLGSDFSYEDMTGERGLLNIYDVELTGEETIQGVPCYRVELTAKRRSVPYPKETWWIDKEIFVTRQAHKFSLSGKLLKEMEVLDTMRLNDKVFPSHIVMRDTMKKRSSTEFTITRIEIGVDLPEDIFSLEELSW
jgi:outer membrane lipoprotein-sorting protein